jgi:predicted membrane chloride channel (bestrophin family)
MACCFGFTASVILIVSFRGACFCVRTKPSHSLTHSFIHSFFHSLSHLDLKHAGSAVFRSLPPSLLSTGIYFILYYTTDLENNNILGHTYSMGALIGALTFLLAFRANFSYNRYWEAVTAVHQMHSKWLDVGLETATFHLQSSRFASIRPPTFGEHPYLKSLERQRERNNEPTLEEQQIQLNEIVALNESLDPKMSLRTHVTSMFTGSGGSGIGRRKHRQEAATAKQQQKERKQQEKQKQKQQHQQEQLAKKSINPKPPPKSGKEALVPPQRNIFGKIKKPIQIISAAATDTPNSLTVVTHSSANAFCRAWSDGRPPPLIRESAHLLSLLSAVALSTLRNDLEYADSPLITFRPGAPWPHVDPDAYGADVRKDWANSKHRSFTYAKYMMGMSRTAADRTLYNAARPFRVMGGVSDAEIELLQAARGPLAKVALCFMWLQEFLTREHLNGGLGLVGPPIVSRLFQFSSDGMLGYNRARKIATIPFPFPHAQITSLFVFIVVVLLPVLMLNYTTNYAVGVLLNLLTVMCFTGLHEVSRELESPFQNFPNELPLNFFQAQFNEALTTMFAGFHPDSYWEVVCTPDDNNINSLTAAAPPTTSVAAADASARADPAASAIGSTNEFGENIVSTTYPATVREGNEKDEPDEDEEEEKKEKTPEGGGGIVASILSNLSFTST